MEFDATILRPTEKPSQDHYEMIVRHYNWFIHAYNKSGMHYNCIIMLYTCRPKVKCCQYFGYIYKLAKCVRHHFLTIVQNIVPKLKVKQGQCCPINNFRDEESYCLFIGINTARKVHNTRVLEHLQPFDTYWNALS